jgi:hypothetical protein
MLGEREIYGGGCVFFSDIENPRCRYFQEAVLPLHKELRGIFSSETLAIQVRDDRKRIIRKKCERPGCGEHGQPVTRGTPPGLPTDFHIALGVLRGICSF